MYLEYLPWKGKQPIWLKVSWKGNEMLNYGSIQRLWPLNLFYCLEFCSRKHTHKISLIWWLLSHYDGKPLYRTRKLFGGSNTTALSRAMLSCYSLFTDNLNGSPSSIFFKYTVNSTVSLPTFSQNLQSAMCISLWTIRQGVHSFTAKTNWAILQCLYWTVGHHDLFPLYRRTLGERTEVFPRALEITAQRGLVLTINA